MRYFLEELIVTRFDEGDPATNWPSKFVFLAIYLRNNSGWARPFRTGDLNTQNDNHSNLRLILNSDNQVTTGEQYHDDIEDSQEEIPRNGNSGLSRVQPSGLAASDQTWQHEA